MRTRYAIITLFIASIVVTSIGYYCLMHAAEGIMAYNPARDRNAILSIFKTDYYWLIPDETTNFSAEYILDNKASSQQPDHKGNLTINVCYAQGDFCGFIAYYKKTSYKGIILFLATSLACRGKGFGKKLLTYALHDLINRGCTVIELFTRINNEKALALYHQVGFKEIWHDAKYVRLTKRIE